MTVLINGQALPDDVTFALAIVFAYLVVTGLLHVADDAWGWWHNRTNISVKER